MVPGRCMAQASHASNALVHKYGKNTEVKEWQRQTKQGFGTTIVLAASIERIDEIFAVERIKWHTNKGKVIDPEYVIRVPSEVANLMHQNYDAKFCSFQFDYSISSDDKIAIVRSEVTCAYILGTKEELDPFLGNLPLY